MVALVLENVVHVEDTVVYLTDTMSPRHQPSTEHQMAAVVTHQCNTLLNNEQ